jgi:hypothetical protein
VELTLMPEPDALTAALLQLSEHADRLTRLDSREAAHAAQAAERVSALTTLASAMKHTLDDQAEVLAGIKDLDRQLAALAARVEEIAPAGGTEGGYEPPPAPRFWKLDGPAREEAIARLRAWVEHVYQPGYGQLAASLGGCWEQHPLCLYALDWLSELWSVLYLQPRRTAGTLAGQAEWQTRLLTAAAGQMAAETARCEHAVPRGGRPVRIGAGS